MDLPEISQKLRAGIQEKRQGNYQKALSLYAEARLIDRTNLDVYGNSARIYGGLLDYDMFLRHVLTRQHLGELLLPDSQINWMQAIMYYAYDNSIGLQIDYDFTELTRRLNPNAPPQRIKLNFCVSDYSLTKAVGIAFCARPENETLRTKLDVSVEQLENSLKIFLGGSAGSTFGVYNPQIDPCLALIGLNVIYTNLYTYRGASVDQETFDPYFTSQLYLEQSPELAWKLRPFDWID